MTEFYYMFELGSGCTWGKYLLPASAYTLHRNAVGYLCLASVVPSSVDMRNIKNLRIINSDGFHAAVEEIMVSKEKK
jgi:hypothetical protein